MHILKIVNLKISISITRIKSNHNGFLPFYLYLYNGEIYNDFKVSKSHFENKDGLILYWNFYPICKIEIRQKAGRIVFYSFLF